ncbi:MAG: glycoside hydrolase family 13 protein [Gaiellaceae bacterium]
MSAIEVRASAGLLDRPHHDGSAGYLLERPDELGGKATVRLRVPRASAPEAVVLRTVRDGEPHSVRAVIDEENETETWWRASFPVTNPSTCYRWLLSGGPLGYAWANGRGLYGRDVTDSNDFVLPIDRGGPDWHLESVVYEIFPDRFARGGVEAEVPGWAVPREWGELPTGRGSQTPYEWFGGDLRGIEQQLDHIESLSANVLYLTPMFPAGSTHRYNASSFDRIDPLLGGNEALDSLLQAAHGRGLRVLGDLTLNHTGDRHEWFLGERSFYYFDDGLPNGYADWLGVGTLPKLNWSSPELRDRMTCVVRRWLDAGLDGWRIDVANMTGRHGDSEHAHEVARLVRSQLEPDELLVAEHGHDFRSDLASGGWHGAMNYAGFLRPVWQWLRRDELPEELRSRFWGTPVGLPRLGGEAVAASMQAFRAGVPWQSLLHSWTLLDSHDTARFRTVAGSRERHEVGIGLQTTMPGVPMVFAGDELGLEGEWGEDARRTIHWNRPAEWDERLLEIYRRLLTLRRSSPALARGGLRHAWIGEDAIAYLRETEEERLLCLAARASHPPIRLALAALGAGELETVYGGEASCAAGTATLPGDGPAFHVWRLRDG